MRLRAGPELERTFGVEPLVGWRTWSIKDFLRLDGTMELRLSPISADLLWPPRERVTAFCSPGNSYSGEPHEAPQPDCMCGIWAVRDRAIAEGMAADMAADMARIYGKVAMWGRVLEFERGFRAQYAYPLELYGDRHSEEGLRALGEIYGVPVHVSLVECAELLRDVAPPAIPSRGGGASINLYMRLSPHLHTGAVVWDTDLVKLSLHTSRYQWKQAEDEFFSDVTDELPATDFAQGNYAVGGYSLQGKRRLFSKSGLERRYLANNLAIGALRPARPFRYGVIRKDTGDPRSSILICCIDFGSDQDPVGCPFTVQWASSGVFYEGVA